MTDISLEATFDELEKIATKEDVKRLLSAIKNFIQYQGGRLHRQAASSFKSLGPHGQVAALGATSGLIGGGLSGVFDGRGKPTIGKRLKRGAKRALKGGAIGGLTAYSVSKLRESMR